MNIINCPECGSKFDVSTFEPGSDFPCTNCRHVLKVPGGDDLTVEKQVAGPKRKRPEGWGKVEATGPISVPGVGKPTLGPKKAAPSRAAAMPGATGGGRRAAATPGPARGGADVEERPSRRRAGRDREPAAVKSSSTPLLLGLGGLGLVVIIVVIAMVAGGGGGEDQPQQAQGGGGGGASEKPVKKETPTDPAKMSRTQRLAVWREMRLKAFGNDEAESIRVWRENYEWASRYGLARQAEEALEAILKKDPQNEYANEKLGRKKFKYPFMPDAEGMEGELIPYADKDLIVEEVEKGKNGEVWVTAEKHAELTRLLEAEKEHRDKIANDVRYKWTKFWINSTSKDPAYSQFKFKVNEEFPPYLVFVQDTGRDLDQAEVAEIVSRNGNILRNLYEQWRSRLEPEIQKLPGQSGFKFPELGVSEGKNPPILKVWVFFDYEDFQTYQRLIRRPLPPGARAYYRRDTQWVTLYEGRGGESQKFGTQDFNQGKVFHEGAHQLHHYFMKLVMSREAQKMGDPAVEFEDISWQSHWFSEGMAELFGGADEVKPNVDWETFACYHSRALEYRRALTRKPTGFDYLLYWRLEEVVKIGGNGSPTSLGRSCFRKTLIQPLHSYLSSLFYAEAWTFNHFLWFAEGGRYRHYLARYALSEMTGKSGWKYFQPIIKPLVDEVGGWDALEKKVIAYLNALPAVGPR